MRADGVPVLGFTWYSFTDQIIGTWNWPTSAGRSMPAACTISSANRAVAAAYQTLLQEFGQITIVPHGELFVVTEQPARLKVEV